MNLYLSKKNEDLLKKISDRGFLGNKTEALNYILEYALKDNINLFIPSKNQFVKIRDLVLDEKLLPNNAFSKINGLISKKFKINFNTLNINIQIPLLELIYKIQSKYNTVLGSATNCSFYTNNEDKKILLYLNITKKRGDIWLYDFFQNKNLNVKYLEVPSRELNSVFISNKEQFVNSTCFDQTTSNIILSDIRTILNIEHSYDIIELGLDEINLLNQKL